MIGYFPTPYPDELLYSLIARFKDHTNSVTYQVMKDLFDDGGFGVNFLFPKRIKTIVKNLNHITNFGEQDLILDRTLYPFISSMRSETKAGRIYSYMADGGLSQSFIPIDGMNKDEFRYCVECSKEDRENFGETYWRRCHNIPLIRTCLRHNIDLAIWKPATNKIFKRGIFPAETVVDTNLAPNDKLGLPILKLKKQSKLRLHISLPEKYLAEISISEQVSFHVKSFPGEMFSGKITRFSKNINMITRSEIVEIEIDNKEGKLLPGMYAITSLPITRQGQSIVVPKTAVITNMEKQFVIKINNGNEVTYVDVEKGEDQIERIEVFGNLSLGDTILNNASDEIKNKSKVKIIVVGNEVPKMK